MHGPRVYIDRRAEEVHRWPIIWVLRDIEPIVTKALTFAAIDMTL